MKYGTNYEKPQEFKMSETSVKAIQISLAQAKPLIIDTLRAQLVPMLVSSPGLGKSALAHQIAEERNLCVIDVRLSQCDPADLNGFPSIDPETGKATYRPMDMFPLEGDTPPTNPETGEPYAGWLLLLDEINSAPKAVEAASYKILLDRMVGMQKLNSRCFVMGAGNKKTDGAVVNSSGTAQQSRMIWFEIIADLKCWLEWADKNKVDHRVKSYLQFKPEMLHIFDPKHQDRTFPCPRTWDFLSRLIKPWDKIDAVKIPLLAGTVGTGPGREFFSYCEIYKNIPTYEQILADPQNVPFGNEPSMHYALAGLVSHHMTAHNAEALFTFLERLGKDFQVTTVRAALARDRDIKKTDAYKDWYKARTWELVY
jgi:hypothetical protein